MIISKIDGGIGNQLFQYAYGYSLAKKNSTAFAIEHHAYAWRPRSFQLCNFNITAEILDFPVAKNNSKPSKLVAELKRYIILKKKYKAKKIFEDRDGIYFYHDEFASMSGTNLYLDGYFQNWRYFEWCKNDIREQFSFRTDSLSETVVELISKVKKEKSVAIHIRKGDYPLDWLIPKSFYIEAYKHIISMVGNDLKFYVFCENIEYAKEIIDQVNNVEIITGNYQLNDFEEFALMTYCKHQIISNSTFSWWAAYLNNFNDKIVFAPVFSKWKRDYYPDNWNFIPV